MASETLTSAQRDVLVLADGGATMTVKHGGFFPGAYIGRKRVHLNTADALLARKLFTQVGHTWQAGAEYVINGAGRAALAATEARRE